MNGIKRILLPLDGSKVSLSGLQAARFLARSLDAEIVVFGCSDRVSDAELGTKSEDTGKPSTGGEGRAPESLEEVVKELSADSIQARSLMATGKPVEQILEAAQSQQVDLIVMASRGRAAREQLDLGSVSVGVLTRAKCPVLIAPVGYCKAL